MTAKPHTNRPIRTVEIIDLQTATAHPETDHDIVRRMMKQPGLTICETVPGAAGGPPRRAFRTPELHCGKAPPAGIAIKPVGIHLRRNGEPDVRFTPDLPADDQDSCNYCGWLPLALIRHPDGNGPHQAWATGDCWIGPSAPGDTRTRPGVQTSALKAKTCWTEALFRRHACWWTDPPPAAWPLSEPERHDRMRHQAEQLCEAAHTLCYDLKLIQRRAQAGERNGVPVPADDDGAALHRIAKVVAGTGVLQVQTASSEGARDANRQ